MRHYTRPRVAAQVNAVRKSLAQQQGLPFAEMLSEEMLREVAGPDEESKEPIYTPLVTLWMFLSQVFDADHSCRKAVARLLSWLTMLGEAACSSGTGAYCKARQRLEEQQLEDLTRHTGRRLHDRAKPEWRWRGRRVKIADGSTATMADTEANQAEYPQPDGQKPGLGFPIVRMVVLFCLATGTVLEAAVGPYSGKGTGELSLLRSRWHRLVPGDVLLADCLYCSWFEMAWLAGRGVDLVLPRHQSRSTDFRRGKRLGPKDHVITWKKPKLCPDWLARKDYEALPEELTLREVEVAVNEAGFRPKKLVVVTTLLDAEQYPAEALGELYWQRWHGELDLRSLKETLQMGQLRCKSPAMVRKEIWAHFLAYNLIRGQMAQAAAEHGLEPRQLSFAGALQTLNAFHVALLMSEDDRNATLHQRLLAALASHRVGQRPGRVEPRAKKRRKKNYPVLTQPRQEARKAILESA